MTCRAIISTALSVEYAAVQAHLTHINRVQHQTGTIYQVGEFNGRIHQWEVALVQTGQGNPRASLEVERAISFFSPSHVFFVGVAGGVKDVKLGDVVAATKVYAYEYGKVEAEFKPRPDFGESSYSLIQEATYISRQNDWLSRVILHHPSDIFGKRPQAFVGPIIAGEKVIASTSSSTYQFIKNNFSDALAVEMESFGFFRAIHANHNVEALSVRGISDLLDKKSEADAAGSQERASAHAAAFVFEVLANIEVKIPQGQNISSATTTTERERDWWKNLVNVAVQLFPLGPNQNEIWSRAGGDISTLNLNVPARGGWYAALNILRLGGGGQSITRVSLLNTMLEDYPSNEELRRLARFDQTNTKMSSSHLPPDADITG
jgi:nucleoside phosphorylase